MPRKTIEVEKIKAKVNHYLKHSEDHRQEGRIASSTLLEIILHETGNYRGFNYLSKVDMEASKHGTVPGINTDRERGAESMTMEERFEGCDESRRYYY